MEIQLSNRNLVTLVDDDFPVHRLKYKWCLSVQGYVYSGKFGFMHHLVLPPLGNLRTDHIDRDKLNNRRSNLRSVLHSQNLMNRPAQVNSGTGVKGVYMKWTRRHGWVYTVKCKRNGEQFFGGVFKDIKDAAKAYNELAIELHGECAYQNPL